MVSPMGRLSPLLCLLTACHLSDNGAITSCEDEAMGCDLDGDGYHASVDCNDNNSAIHPDADEICDSIENDCDGSVDDQDDSLVDGMLLYEDGDGDGYGNPAQSILACELLPSHVEDSLDCNDSDSSIHPDAVESCDDVDSDCDGAEITDLITLNGSNFGDLSDALDSAQEGDEVYVCEGTWEDSLSLAQSIEIRGVGDPSAVIIHPPEGNQGVLISGGDVVIDGLTITGGTGVMLDSLSDTVGGGIALMSGSLVLRNSILSNHSAAAGAALVLGHQVGGKVDVG